MIQFTNMLEDEFDKSSRALVPNGEDVLKKMQGQCLLLEDVFDRLRIFIHDYRFKDESEEILFFKQVKPNLFSNLIYYRKVYNLEMNRPTGGEEEQKKYLERELRHINYFFDKNRAFYSYYRSENSHMDAIYFLRKKSDVYFYQESFYFERDPQFSTNCDFKVAKVLANEKVEEYVKEELAKLDETGATFTSNLRWTASKIDLIELIYALFETKVFNNGRATLKELMAFFSMLFNIDLGTNPSRDFYDLRIRQKRTSFLDKLRKYLRDRMDEKDDN